MQYIAEHGPAAAGRTAAVRFPDLDRSTGTIRGRPGWVGRQSDEAEDRAAPIDITTTPEWAALAEHHAAVGRRH